MQLHFHWITRTIMPIRTLYIGLGGAGAKSILYTKKCFVDAYGEVPPMAGFLAIDTDTAIEQLEFKSRKGDDVKFDSNEICFCGIQGIAVAIVNHYPAQYQRLPSRNKRFLNNLQGVGAGPVRSNGRFLAKYNATYIQNLIITKFAQIANENMVLQDDIVENYTIHVNIVGSAAGGTGSGMFLDIMVLAAKILRERKCRFCITPWILLPDVFRQMAPGIPSAHCFANAYGLLKELDYLYHLSHNNQQPIDFLFDQVYHLDESIEGAYLINNVNEHREPLLHVDELTELIGRCMFLPALQASIEFWTIRDAMRHLRNSGIYTICNKEAHYASVGFAEIVYDNQAIGNVIARGIIGKICNELCQCNTKEILNAVDYKVIATEKAPGAIGPYSQGYEVNGFVFSSGQIPVNPETGEIPEGIAAQAEQSCKNVGAILEAAGVGYENVVKTTCFLAEMADFTAFNEVYAKYFTSKPARSCVAAKDLPKGVLCEIEAIAVK